MKKSKFAITILSFCLYNIAFGDGGSGSNASWDCKGTVACPAGQTGSISFIEGLQAWDKGKCPSIISTFSQHVQNGYSDSDLAYYLKKAGWSTRPTIVRNCVSAGPFFKEFAYNNSKKTCPEDKPLGVINIQQKYEIWSDGSIRNQSAWYETSNSCTALVEKITEVRQGSETVSCDSYYSTQAGTYNGNVTKIGEYISTFNPSKNTTETYFQVKSYDITSCQKAITSTSKEYIEENCPNGQSGKIIKFIIKAESEKGTVYPYGQTPIIESQNCSKASIDDSKNDSTKETYQNSIISNLSLTTTSISKSDVIFDTLKKVDSSKLENKTYTLNIIADDLSVSSFDKNKLTKIITTFKSKSNSANVKLASVPNSLEKFIGQNGLTLDKIKNERLSMTGAKIEGGTVTVKYLSLNSTKPVQSSFTVKVFE